MQNFSNDFLAPTWPAPKNIIAFTTFRYTNIKQLNLPLAPVWLDQVHGGEVVQADVVTNKPKADASFTTKTNIVCAVRTADCLPLFMCDKAGENIAVIHAGWKSLAANIIENTVKKLSGDLLVWLGPAIGPEKFEVEEDMVKNFPQDQNAFIKISDKKHLCDIYQIARNRLNNFNIKDIYGGTECTYTNDEKFYSYRRDKETCRMLSLIWKRSS